MGVSLGHLGRAPGESRRSAALRGSGIAGHSVSGPRCVRVVVEMLAAEAMPHPVPELRGVLVGDSQLKFLCRSRLRLAPFVSTCTFSFGGHDAASLQGAIAQTRFHRADFAIVYIGGNDLDKGTDPREIVRNIKDLVTLLQEHVASTVLVFTVLPRHYDDTRKAHVEGLRRRQLNRRLTGTLKRLSGVRILNPEHRFLDASKKPRPSLFAADGYHVARDRGIDQMAKIIVAALVAIYGPGIVSASRASPGELYVVHRCRRCQAKGHEESDCSPYCSPRRHTAARHL